MSTPAAKKRKIDSSNSTLFSWLGAPPSSPAASKTKDDQPATPQKQSKSRKTGIDPKWQTEFPLLLITTEGDGMLCKHCKKYAMRPKNGTDVWIGTPCTTLTKDSLQKHARTKMHEEAAQRATSAILASSGRGIESSIAQQASLEKKALIGAFQTMYWLAKEEIAHTTHYASLLELAKSLGCEYLNLLRKGDNVNYTSQRTMQDMLQCISQQINGPIIDELRDCSYFAMMVDETTDVAVLKQLTIMVRYLKRNAKPELKTHFLRLIDLPDGKADTIMTALLTFLTEMEVPVRKLAGLGSDGASVMVGRKTGVATQLRAINPELINVHCIAHRLALASAQAANAIPYLMKFKDILQQLFKFYQNSAVRMAGLKEIESILGDPAVKLKEIADTRWLFHENAVTAIRRCLPALITSLEREAAERTDATAAGLATFVKQPKFICTIAMLSDVLPHLSMLSKAFQRTSVDFTMINPMVSATQVTLLRMKDYPGPCFTALDQQFTSLKEFGVKGSDADIQRFQNEVFTTYIQNVIDNLHDRFPDNTVLDAMTVLDPDLLPKDDPTQHEWLQHQKLQTLADHFKSVGSLDAAKTEYSSMRELLVTEQFRGLTFREALMKIVPLRESYPCLATYAEIALILPVSTADCERTFSTMGSIKTTLRNRLSQRILNSLMTISTEGPALKDFNFDQCVKFFGQLKKRKIATE